jgi:hypothetical protein
MYGASSEESGRWGEPCFRLLLGRSLDCRSLDQRRRRDRVIDSNVHHTLDLNALALISRPLQATSEEPEQPCASLHIAALVLLDPPDAVPLEAPQLDYTAGWGERSRRGFRARYVWEDRLVDDLVAVAIASVARHPAVRDVELAGSRARGTHEELSDWDFAVETADFAAVASDMPTLVAALNPLGEQWEPLGHFPVYQVFLRGPTKVEYLFLEHEQDAMPPVTPSRETLAAINTHFWDWIWWIATKASAGRDDLVAEHLAQLHRHLLQPMGLHTPPRDIDTAIHAFVRCRDELERQYGRTVSRVLEDEVRGGIRRIH